MLDMEVGEAMIFFAIGAVAADVRNQRSFGRSVWRVIGLDYMLAGAA